MHPFGPVLGVFFCSTSTPDSLIVRGLFWTGFDPILRGRPRFRPRPHFARKFADDSSLSTPRPLSPSPIRCDRLVDLPAADSLLPRDWLVD